MGDDRDDQDLNHFGIKAIKIQDAMLNASAFDAKVQDFSLIVVSGGKLICSDGLKGGDWVTDGGWRFFTSTAVV